jgi:predicted nucleotidyltransferase
MGMIKRQRKGSHRADGFSSALFTKVQQSVLSVLFGNPTRSFYANEIIGLAKSGTGAVQRELAALEAAGLVRMTRVGNQKHYQANASAPIFEELRSLVLKTFGLTDVLRAALAPLSREIRAAFVYGSIAKREENSSSDVDLMVTSDSLSYSDLFAELEDASIRLGRKISPTVISLSDLIRRAKEDNAFMTRILAQPKIWVIGSDRDLKACGLCGDNGPLHHEEPDAKEFAGLRKSGLAKLADAEREVNSPESRFDLAYSAAFALSLAALRRLGYRPSNKRYVVFQALPHTLGLGPEVWRVLDKCHQQRNLVEYTGEPPIDGRLLEDLIKATKVVAAALDKLPSPPS